MKILKVFAWLYPSYAQMNVAAAVVGSAVVGGAMSSSASKKAANAQSAAAAQADATQRYQFDETNRLNAPFREGGLQANNALLYRLGIGGTAGNRDPSTSLANASLTQGTGYNSDLYASNDAYRKAWDEVAQEHYNAFGKNYNETSDMGWVEQRVRGLLANDIEAAKKAQQDAEAQNVNDPNYGSLLRNFSQADLDADPIYQNTFKFALDSGTQGVNRQAAATGSLLSGNTLKALSRFGANTAATYGNDAFNRNNTEKVRTYNSLAGVSSAGQQATNQINAAGQNMANNISSNQIGLGNARGASAIAGANSFNNALSSGVNAYQQNALMKSISQSNPYAGTGYTNADVQGLQGYQGIY